MRTFTDLITERFVDGLQSGMGYAEIFINPSLSELRKMGKSHGKDSGEYEHALVKLAPQGFVPPFKFLAAFVSETDWYVWDRGVADHFTIKRHLAKELEGKKFYPVYAYYFMSSNALFVMNAFFSADIDTQTEMRRGIVKAILNTSSQFKQFGTAMVLR